LVEYYSQWAASGDPHAPRYTRINGSPPVEQVREQLFAALAAGKMK
jgi:adenylate kinase